MEPFGTGRKPQNGIYGKDEKTSFSLVIFKGMKKLTLLLMSLVSLTVMYGQTKCDWTKQKPGHKLTCNNLIYESGSIDTCVSYQTKIIHNTSIDTVIESRMIRYTFKDTGNYVLRTRYYDKCHGCDTVIYTSLRVECLSTSGIKNLYIGEPKLIGVYDMMGRPVSEILMDKIYVYMYDNGVRKKVLIQSGM